MSQRQRILVTGAAGFVGSRLVRHLLEEGECVRAFVRPGADLGGFAGLPSDRLEVAYGDVTIAHTVYRALAGCGRMYHLATVFGGSEARPERVLGPAVEGTRATLDAARRRDLERVVVTSSVAALGTTAEPSPMDETHAPGGTVPELYAMAKQRALAVAEAAADRGEPVVIVMPSAILGPGDRRPTPVGAAILRYLRARGGFPAIPGGVSVADVDDVVRGHVLAMQHGALGRRYILGGDNVTYAQLVTALATMTGRAPPRHTLSVGLVRALAVASELGAFVTGREPQLTRRLAAARVGRYSWVTSARAEAEFGYQHRPFEVTLRRAVTWFLRQGRIPDPLGRRLRYELEAR